ncbi:hypothetical protein [Timonella senegalensis]|uniref:hypothetical protein n=1 Tax=Timonella senegalensis TaxID=1465825 RepID=UPI002FDE9332
MSAEFREYVDGQSAVLDQLESACAVMESSGLDDDAWVAIAERMDGAALNAVRLDVSGASLAGPQDAGELELLLARVTSTQTRLEEGLASVRSRIEALSSRRLVRVTSSHILDLEG